MTSAETGLHRPCAASPPAIGNWDELHSIITEQLDQANRGQMSVVQALKAAALSVNAVLAKVAS